MTAPDAPLPAPTPEEFNGHPISDWNEQSQDYIRAIAAARDMSAEVKRLRAERDLLRAEVRAWRRLIAGLNEPELDAAR